MAGHIRLSRDILGWGWYGDPNTKSVFLHLLLTANWKDGEYKGHAIKRGEVVVGLSRLADTLGLSVRNVRTALEHLKSTSDVTIKTTNKFSIITICKFEHWQQNDETIDKQTDKQTDKQPTNNRQTTDKQLTTSNKERSKEERNKEEYISLADFENRRERDSLLNLVEMQKKQMEDMQNQIEKLTEEKKEKKERDKTSYTPDFEEDFQLYQRKGSKARAFMRWQKLSSAERERMRKHIPFYLQSNERQYLKDFEGYINQRTFDSPVYDRRGSILFDPEQNAQAKYLPHGRGVAPPYKDGLYIYVSPLHNGEIFDGYEDDTRPDGARIKLNNARGIMQWSSEKRKWEAVQ